MSTLYPPQHTQDGDRRQASTLLADSQSWDELSEHRTGTEGDLQTSQRLITRMQGSPVVPILVQSSMVQRIPQSCYVKGDSFRIEGIPLFDCTPTDESGLQGSLVDLGDSGDICVETLTASGADMTSRSFLECRTSGSYQALIAVSKNSHPGIAMLNADRFGESYGVPVLMVDGFEAEQLLQAKQKQESVKVCVNFEERRSLQTNVEVVIPGKSSHLAPVVVMTPKSSWWTSTAERIGGIAAWLACIRTMAVSQPERSVIFTANSGHELGHTGLHAFLKRHQGLASEAFAWVHLGANLGALDSRLRLQISSDKLQELALRSLNLAELNPDSIVEGNLRPGGEARDIFDAGGSYISLLGSNHLFHHPTDRLNNNVEIEVVGRICDAVVAIVSELAFHPK